MFTMALLLCKLSLTLAIPVAAYTGDCLVTIFEEKIWFKAFSDNITHGVISALTWMVFNISKGRQRELWAETVLCFVLASFIDLDHFIQAKSFRLQNLKDLKTRPIFHCTLLVLFVAMIFCLTSHIISSRSMNLIGWSLMVAALSHHTRDATRRGFWLYPFGSTPSLPYWLYLMTLMVIPYSLDVARYSIQDSQTLDHSDLSKKKGGLMQLV